MVKTKREVSTLTPTKDGLLTALKGRTGAIPNGRLKAAPRAKPRVKNGQVSGRVVQLRPPVLGFTCDACGWPSYGWKAMCEHVEDTGHLTYTAIKD